MHGYLATVGSVLDPVGALLMHCEHSIYEGLLNVGMAERCFQAASGRVSNARVRSKETVIPGANPPIL